MITKKFSIEINANAEKVWYALWDSAYFPKWSLPFAEGRSFICDWEEDEKLFFMSPGGIGKASILKKVKLYSKIEFTHLCEMTNYEEPDEDEWTGARENYTLKETNGLTKLTILADFPDNHEVSYSEKFTKAIELIKQISENLKIILELNINSTLMAVWRFYTTPEHIKRWNFATELWHVTNAENDLQEGGQFCIDVETYNGVLKYSLKGTYTKIQNLTYLEYNFTDGRKGTVSFEQTSIGVKIREVFDPIQNENVFMQKSSRQLTLYNFQKYVEKNSVPKFVSNIIIPD